MATLHPLPPNCVVVIGVCDELMFPCVAVYGET